MQNKVDYFIHQIFTPNYYHRQYENDLPQEKEETSYTEGAKRAVHIALPFLSLYRPLGAAISLSMGSVRVLTSGAGLIHADSLPKGAQQAMQLGLATLALVGTLYHFTLGLYLTTGADLVSNFTRILERLHALQFQQAGEELLQALGSGLYLAIMMTGSLEVVLTSLLVQALISVVQAKEEWKQGRMPEAMAKTLMGMVRLYQANQQHALIQKRETLFQQYKELKERIQRGRKIDHLWDHPAVREAKGLAHTKITDPMNNHPLNNLDAQIDEKRVVLKDANDTEYDFGAHFFGYGKQQVKGMNITFKNQGEESALEFKINHVFRDRLEVFLQNLEKISPEDLKQLLDLNHSHIKGVTIGKKALIDEDFWLSLGEEYEIDLQGLGKILIGGTPETISFYDRVTVKMEKGKTLYDFHEALSFLNLDDALRQSATEDIDRMKMGHLYRMFAPKEATFFERNEAFFDLPMEQFKQEILARSPEMEGVFNEWLSKMELRETLPGRMRFAVDGLSDELQKQGALGLTAAVYSGNWWEQDNSTNFERIASMLKMGMLSHEIRERNGMNANGLSWGLDYMTGGADSVYTQIVTKNNKSFDEYAYQTPVRLIISPKIFEMGTYQYHTDNFGNRMLVEDDWWWFDKYIDRNNISDFLTVEKLYFNSDNEVMIKDRIPPEYFTGIVVDNASTKQDLLEYLRGKDLVQMDSSGHETILSRPIDEFLYVGDAITKELFAYTETT